MSERKKKEKSAAPFLSFQWCRENLDSIAIALIAALAIRHFTLEAFKIPTKSMQPTLMGNQPPDRRVRNGALRWLAWLLTRSGDRILVGKPLFRLRGPRRWDVIVFVYPWAYPYCKHCKSPENEREVWRAPPEDVCPRLACGKRGTVPIYRHFIKRLVGLPGEDLWIQDGDVYINGALAPKPRGLQASLWQRVADDELLLMEGLAATDDQLDWRITSSRERYATMRSRLRKLRADRGELLKSVQRGAFLGAGVAPVWNARGDWDLGGLEITGKAPAGKEATLTYARPIKDFYADDRDLIRMRDRSLRPHSNSGTNTVGDLRLCFRVRMGGWKGGAVRAAVGKNDDLYEFRIPWDKGDAELIHKDRAGGTVAVVATAKGKALNIDREPEIDIWYWDGRIRVSVDGREVLTHVLPAREPPTPVTVSSSVQLGVSGGSAIFRDVRIQRDIYYTSNYLAATSAYRWGVSEDGPVSIPEGYYFVLGDNSPSSKDGRMWEEPPFVPESYMSGKAILRFFPARIGVIR